MMDRSLKYRARIVSNRPMPAISDKKGAANSKYNLHSMAVESHFFVLEKDASKARAAAYMYAKRSGKKFSSRRMGDGWVMIFREE